MDQEAALDELYGAAPEEFVPTRTRLVSELRAAGATEEAARVQRLRRPPLSVWAVNQAVRHEPTTLADLVTATHELATAQREMLAGNAGTDELRAATRRRGELLAILTDAAVAALRDHAPKPAAHRDAIAHTFDAATLDAEATTNLRAGRMTEAMVAPATFGPLDMPALPGMPAGPSARPASARRPSAREVTKAERALDAARRAADEAALAAERAEAEVVSADLAAESALMHLQDVDRARDRARDEVSHTSTRLTEAQRAASQARSAVDETLRGVASREASLADLRDD